MVYEGGKIQITILQAYYFNKYLLTIYTYKTAPCMYMNKGGRRSYIRKLHMRVVLPLGEVSFDDFKQEV